jgi:hypothetical protein
VSRANTAKPARIEVIADNIPERLRNLRRWVVWNWRLRGKSWDKPPRQTNGGFASVDDSATWATFDEALAAHRAGTFDGVGFVLGPVEEEGVTYIGLDLDDCRNPATGEIALWAASHLQSLDTYAEVSPSGAGIKAVAIGTPPGPDRNESDRLGIELYADNRYFTLTGQRLLDAPAEIAERTEELHQLYVMVFGEVEETGRTTRGRKRPQDRELALSALAGLSPSLADGYWPWLRAGMALHGVSDDDAMLQAWDRWSQHCADKYRPGVCEQKWESFDNKGGLGLGSLIYWAKQNGWVPPQYPKLAQWTAQADGEALNRLDEVLTDGGERLFRDRELLKAIAGVAEQDPAEFSCVRARVQRAKVSLRDLDASITQFRGAIRAQRPPRESAETYRIVAGRIVHLRKVKDGQVEVPLCNFRARIAEVITRDDGVERTALFGIQGQLANGRPLIDLKIPAADFQRLEWVTTGWHGEAVVFAGAGTRDHTRCAIELLSGDRARRDQFLHTGWREVRGEWLFLHAGGAIGKDGLVAGVEVDLAGALGRVQLPQPPSGTDLACAVRASLGILTLGPLTITAPGLAATYRAPLGDIDFSLHLSGPSGVFKTEFAALLQSHFGSLLDARSLPGSWSSTENALEELAFAGKDVLIAIDDFKPRGSAYEVQSYHRKADRLFRAVGNHSGRQRLTREAKLRPDHRPRGLIFSTGEETPVGESLLARVLVQEIGPGDIVRGRLTECQRDAADGRYAAAMSLYLRWLAGRYPEIRAELRGQRDRLRERAQAEIAGAHARSPGIVADLALGLKFLFEFAVDVGAITEAQRSDLARQCWAALRDAVTAQTAHVTAAEPTGQFFRLISAALASGRAHLAGPSGLAPEQNPSAWGWRQVDVLAGGERREEWRAFGERVGWVECGLVGKVGSVRSEEVFLEPEASFAVVQALAREQAESLPVSARTLRRRLKERGLCRSRAAAKTPIFCRCCTPS